MFHFTMFQFNSVTVDLFIDSEEPTEEGRIITNVYDPITGNGYPEYYASYSGLSEKRACMAQALLTASKYVTAE